MSPLYERGELAGITDCGRAEAIGSPGRVEPEKAVPKVTGGHLKIIFGMSNRDDILESFQQGSRWRLCDAVEAVRNSENNGIWTAL